MDTDIHQLITDVRLNCDIADANFAGNYTMCIYLLKMRELYRWSNSIDQSSSLSSEQVSEWVQQKEAYWESLESEEFRAVSIDGRSYDVFDVETINKLLIPKNLVYGAGYGRGCRPQFFLAELQYREAYPSYDVLVSDHEYARDLAAPVAMSQGRMIYVRRESLKRMMWEYIEAWRWRKSPPDEPLAHALSHFPIDSDPEEALDDLTQIQVEYAINHEVGEVVATEMLGSQWTEMLMQHPGSRLELIARAVKDHLADALVTLPEIMQSDSHAAIHLYFANLTPLRKKLFPQLEEAYESWKASGAKSLNTLIAISHAHWLEQAESLLQRYRETPEQMNINDDDLAQYTPSFSF